MRSNALSDAFALFLVNGFLDRQTCANIRAEARAAPGHPAPVYLEGSSDSIHQTVRRTTSVELSEVNYSFVQNRLFAQKSSIEEHFNLTLSDCEKPQFLLYRPGDFFVRHQDGNTNQLEFDHLRIRKISIVLFLSDASEDQQPDTYTGGELVFYRASNQPGESPLMYELMGEAGLLVGFAADTIHEVRPVLHGERFAAVSWFR
jgi:SM-20-related protein